MRPRYLAAAGPKPVLETLFSGVEVSGAVPLGEQKVAPALRVWTNASLPLLPLPGERGAVLGSLYRSGSHERVEHVSADLAQRIASTRGRILVDEYWGSYVLLLSYSEEEHVVLRDPSASIPVYYAQVGEAHLYASDYETSALRGLVRGQPDLQFVAQAAVFPFLRTARTGVDAVRELLPGCRHSVTGGCVSIDAVWSAWRFAAADAQFTSFERAAAALRAEALAVVPRQAGGGGRTSLELSGGLDSSIIAAALAQAGVPFNAVTFATVSPDGDERLYARKVARSIGTELHEIGQAEGPLDFTPPAVIQLRPGPSPALQPLHRAFGEFGRANAIDTFVTGAGGDNLFCFLTTASPAIDAARTVGLRQGLATLGDLSEICGCTLWTAARFAVRKALRPSRPPHWPRETDFLTQAAADVLPDDHPWLQAPPGTLPGKREHVRALLHVQHFLDAANSASDARFVHPLLAQPLLELCLRVPSWMWARDGRNRAVARAAFADLLPREILDRRSKGRLESVFIKAFVESRPRLRGLLLDGRLQRLGLLDRAEVERYLAQSGEPADPRYFRVLELSAIELWLRSWSA